MKTEYLRTAGLALLLSTAACGGEEAAEAPETTPADQPAATPTPAPTTGGTAAPANLPEGVTAAQFQQGQQIFEGQGICFTCHASDGSGSALAPALNDGTWIWVDAAAGDELAQISDIVRQGVPQPQEYPAPMPPMGGAQLSDEQVEAVSAYVYAISRGE